MKVIILAGGLGTRISEESHLKPKPMIEIGGKPILWHIMKGYARYGWNEFIICCGYKQHLIKEYFADYYLHNCDVTFDFRENNHMTVHQSFVDPWRITLVDTGLNTMTGGRVKRVAKYIGQEPFMLTYGDGVSDINIQKLADFHKSHGKVATVSTISAGQRFGVLDIDEAGQIHAFREKNDTDGSIINGGFMMFQPEVLQYIEGDSTVLEREPMERLAAQGQLMAYRHSGFWRCMDTQRDKQQLEELWASGNAKWRTW